MSEVEVLEWKVNLRIKRNTSENHKNIKWLQYDNEEVVTLIRFYTISSSAKANFVQTFTRSRASIGQGKTFKIDWILFLNETF